MATKTILDRIMANKRDELARNQRRVSEGDLRALMILAPPPRDLARALRAPGVSLIAEAKRASPSRGVLRNGYEPATLAKAYEKGGAAAISVLTDLKFFQGTLDHLSAAREATRLPVLRKDFIFDPYQLMEARAAGADAVLLIARLLPGGRLRSLREEAERLGMQALVEVHDAAEVEHALDSGAEIIGVNNRDLATFEIDLETTARLRDRVPSDRVLVAESGIWEPEHVRRLAEIGADAMLVGTRLMRAKDPGARARELVAAGRPV